MKIDRLLKELDPLLAKALSKALAGPAANTDIAAVLTKHGHPISEAAVRRWRSKNT